MAELEAHAGLTGNYVDGVFFTEQPAPGGTIGSKPITVKIHRQNASLPEVKRRLAEQVVRQGGNALTSFSYGQKRTFFQWDDVAWYGTGWVTTL